MYRQTSGILQVRFQATAIKQVMSLRGALTSAHRSLYHQVWTRWHCEHWRPLRAQRQRLWTCASFSALRCLFSLTFLFPLFQIWVCFRPTSDHRFSKTFGVSKSRNFKKVNTKPNGMKLVFCGSESSASGMLGFAEPSGELWWRSTPWCPCVSHSCAVPTLLTSSGHFSHLCEVWRVTLCLSQR